MFVGFGVAELLGGFILCGIRLVESYGMGVLVPGWQWWGRAAGILG